MRRIGVAAGIAAAIIVAILTAGGCGSGGSSREGEHDPGAGYERSRRRHCWHGIPQRGNSLGDPGLR